MTQWNRTRLPLRMAMLLVGIYLMGLGVALFVKSDTGTTPIVSLPFVLNQIFPAVSLGTFNFLFNVVFFVGQFVAIPRSFSWDKFLQIIPNALLGIAIDGNGLLLSHLKLESYGQQLLAMAGGCLALGLCIALMVSANVILMPIDAFISTLARRSGLAWGNTKCILDVIMVVMAAGLGLLFLGRIVGVREGTLVAALTVGQLSRLFRPATDLLAGPAAQQV